MRTSFEVILHATVPAWNRGLKSRMIEGIKRKAFLRRLASCLSLPFLIASLAGCNFVKSVFLGPSITTRKVPNAVVGKAYDAKIEISGALFADIWISAGALPPGLKFQGGRISGVPITGGSYGFQVSATDNSGDYPLNDDRRFTILVLDITAPPLVQATANRNYGPVTLTTVGQVGTVNWAITSGTLPEGMLLKETGELQGAAADGGNYPFTVIAVDQDTPPRSKSQDFVLDVDNPVPGILALTPASAGVGTASFTLQVQGFDFVKSSRVLWDAGERPTTFIDTTRLNAAIPATDLANPGNPAITVSSPLPGGGISNALSFAITSGAAATLLRVSVDTAGVQSNGPSGRPAISANGRFVAFESQASNLVVSDHNGQSDIFVRDTCRRAGPGCFPSTVRVSLGDVDSETNGPSYRPSISADGRYVVFTSLAGNLLAGETNSSSNVFLRDTCLGAPSDCRPRTILVSVANTNSASRGNNDNGKVSSSGRYVAFSSDAGNLVPEDRNGAAGIFLRDTCIGSLEPCEPTTIRVSLDELERPLATLSTDLSISSNGRFVAFAARSFNSPFQDIPAGSSQVYVRDTCASAGPDCHPSTTVMPLQDENGVVLAGGFQPSISPDGRFVTFIASKLTSSTASPNELAEVFIRDTCTGAEISCHSHTSRLSAPARGEAPDESSVNPATTVAGRYAAFVSRASNLVADDKNERADVFLRDTCAGIKSCLPATWRVSRGLGREADGDSTEPALTPDGKVLVFASVASTLIQDDTNGVADIYLYQSDNAL